MSSLLVHIGKSIDEDKEYSHVEEVKDKEVKQRKEETRNASHALWSDTPEKRAY